MLLKMNLLLVLTVFVALLAIVACGGSEDAEHLTARKLSSDESVMRKSLALEDSLISRVSSAFRGEEGRPAPPPVTPTPAPRIPRPAPVPTAAPAAAAPVAQTLGEAVVVDVYEVSGSTAQLVSQERIIVRTVEATIVVDDVQDAVDRITVLAKELDGWVVSTNQVEKHRGFISFRVPADTLDTATARLREMAFEVRALMSHSQDVTDEYVDLTARLDSQEATEEALFRLLERAETVEAALKVRQTLSEVQQEVESLKGRIKLLEETSAFSLVSVHLELKPMEMAVNEIGDKTAGVDDSVRFRAFFKPPEGIEEFEYTWDFGDGERARGNQTAPTEREDTRVTATVTHRYQDEEDSPFIVQFRIAGSGEAGAAEGETTFMVNVTRIPNIVVFAGESITVDEGEEVQFSGSFTRPPGLKEIEYQWDFGDGSEPATGGLGAGITTVTAAHVYENHRPFTYPVTLTITAESETGTLEGSNSLDVWVKERPGWVFSGWSFSDQGRSAVRFLSGIGQAALIVVIWAAILSPAWLIVGGGGYWLIRKRRARRRPSDTAQGEVEVE